MKRRLFLVFAGLIACAAVDAARAQAPVPLDPAKLRLASANAVGDRRVRESCGLRQRGRRRHAHRLAHQADDRDRHARRGPAARRAGRDRHRRFRLPQGHALAAADGRGAAAAGNAAARADGFGEPRGGQPCAQLPRGHRRVRGRHEREGADARHDADALRRRDGPVGAERFDGERSREARRGRGAVRGNPRIQHDAEPLRRSPAHRADPRVQQHEPAGRRTPTGTSSCRRPATSAKPENAWSCSRRSRASRS